MLFRRSGRSLIVHSPAKVNLFLEILGKRSDGYHELETLMVSVGLYDTLSFTQEASDEIRLRTFLAGSRPQTADAGAEIPGGADNLVVKAASLLRDHAGAGSGVRVDLTKRIPAAAGLAGGSSNAAATLAALNRLWDLKLDPAELHGLAARLGSDIGFFLGGAAAAVCRGRGEIVEPLGFPLGLHFVIVRPPAGLSTSLVYRHCRPADRPRHADELAACLKRGRLARAAACLHNALQAPAERLNVQLTELKARFGKQPVLGHLMSGSGSAWFGLCATRRQALAVAARLRAGRIGSVFVAQSRP